MSHENVEVVRVAHEAFTRGGLDRVTEHFTDDVESHVLADVDDLIHGMELLEAIDAGGVTVPTAERYGGRARLSGVETDSANRTVFTIRDAKNAGGPRVRDSCTGPRSRRAAVVSDAAGETSRLSSSISQPRSRWVTGWLRAAYQPRDCSTQDKGPGRPSCCGTAPSGARLVCVILAL
jgi:hypothetical protein